MLNVPLISPYRDILRAADGEHKIYTDNKKSIPVQLYRDQRPRPWIHAKGPSKKETSTLHRAAGIFPNKIRGPFST